MGEFAQLEKELRPVFAEIERIKEKHRITSITLESFNLIDQFHGSHGGKGSFMGKREYKHTRSVEQNFVKVKWWTMKRENPECNTPGKSYMELLSLKRV